jgi:hypothetical protein
VGKRGELACGWRQVYDIAFATGTDVFASVGADGSVRLFDLRCDGFSATIAAVSGTLASMGVPEPWKQEAPGRVARAPVPCQYGPSRL